MSQETEYSPFPWTIRFCDGLGLQYMIIDAEGDMVGIGEYYSEHDMVAMLRVFLRNTEIRLDSDSLNALRDRRQRETIRREILLEPASVKARAPRRKKQGTPVGADSDGEDHGGEEGP